MWGDKRLFWQPGKWSLFRIVFLPSTDPPLCFITCSGSFCTDIALLYFYLSTLFLLSLNFTNKPIILGGQIRGNDLFLKNRDKRGYDFFFFFFFKFRKSCLKLKIIHSTTSIYISNCLNGLRFFFFSRLPKFHNVKCVQLFNISTHITIFI